MSNNSMRDMFKLSFGEEVGNSVSHGAMAGLILLLLPISTIYAYTRGGLALGLSTGIYMISILLMFLCSCVYHSMEFGSSQKYVMRILDHCFIFVAIAGTYTPILVYMVGGYMGYGLLVLQWFVTIVGIVSTAVSKNYHKKLSLTLYLVMGWIGILILPTLLRHDLMFFGLILLGGVFYSIGVYFYVKKFPYAHFIWHIFIVLASIAHYVAIMFYL